MTKKSFAYTNYYLFGWDSHFVRAIYFNSKNGELLVELAGEKLYKYSNFTIIKFNSFKEAGSAGTYYNSCVKNDPYVISEGFFGYLSSVDFTDLKSVTKTEYEVTVQVTLTTTVRVASENFDSAARLAMDEVTKIQGYKPDAVSVTGVKKL